ncbi:hypothetical protein [Leeuwenhoekiella marinoflava]|uniref:hypothetical protein n=1 Tax=Leeuwenhoekiella marinoflava TaxID=988 RepID=UPI003002C36B
MQNLTTIAEIIWQNRVSFNIEPKEIWDSTILTEKWFKSTKELNTVYTSGAPGWYWISLETSFEELQKLNSDTCKKAGCKIDKVAASNLALFTEKLLCKKDDKGMLIIYNGHQNKVLSRLRQHFVLNNDGTGALGFNAYKTLAIKHWTISYFSAKHIQNLPTEYQQVIKSLINSSVGRVAVETAWRASNGWPILCKA